MVKTLTTRVQKHYGDSLTIYRVRVGEYGNVEIEMDTEFGIEWVPTPYNPSFFHKDD